MSTRSRKAEKIYKQHQQAYRYAEECAFCNPDGENVKVDSETKSFYIIKNRFPYTQWDGQGVDDHLMVVPKKHTETLSDLTAEESVEFTQVLGSFENQGYSVYARAPVSNRKSVLHQHTHLIKLDQKNKPFLLVLNKPYLRITTK